MYLMGQGLWGLQMMRQEHEQLFSQLTGAAHARATI
jgi:hypothetical protein